MAEIALPWVRVLNSRDLFGDHMKMLHVMARRCLMTLRAVLGFRSRVSVAWDFPGAKGVTVGTGLPEERPVGIFRPVTRGAIKHLGERLAFIGVLRAVSSQPLDEI